MRARRGCGRALIRVRTARARGAPRPGTHLGAALRPIDPGVAVPVGVVATSAGPGAHRADHPV